MHGSARRLRYELAMGGLNTLAGRSKVELGRVDGVRLRRTQARTTIIDPTKAVPRNWATVADEFGGLAGTHFCVAEQIRSTGDAVPDWSAAACGKV